MSQISNACRNDIFVVSKASSLLTDPANLLLILLDARRINDHNTPAALAFLVEFSGNAKTYQGMVYICRKLTRGNGKFNSWCAIRMQVNASIATHESA